jgi:hypothetical protein
MMPLIRVVNGVQPLSKRLLSMLIKFSEVKNKEKGYLNTIKSKKFLVHMELEMMTSCSTLLTSSLLEFNTVEEQNFVV